jgi:hypothetical protein
MWTLSPVARCAIVAAVPPSSSIVPADLRRRLEEARLDNLALMRALDRVFRAGPPVAQPVLRAWYELEADCCEGLWALDQPPGRLDVRAMVRDTLASLQRLPAARDRVRAALTPAERHTLGDVEAAIRAALDPDEAYSQVAGRDPSAPAPRRGPGAASRGVPAPAPRAAAPRPGRNDPCPCGSGKKYKKCCALRSPEAPAAERPAFRFEPGSYGGPGGFFPSIVCHKETGNQSEMHFVLANAEDVYPLDQDAVERATEDLDDAFAGGPEPERVALHLRELGYLRVEGARMAVD